MKNLSLGQNLLRFKSLRKIQIFEDIGSIDNFTYCCHNDLLIRKPSVTAKRCNIESD